MPLVHRAAWVLPISVPPIRNGWVAVEDGWITAVGGPGDTPPAAATSRGEALAEAEAILPGLVNAHTHLELSWMGSEVPPAASMPAWAARLIARRASTPGPHSQPIVEAVGEMRAAGTSLVGEVTNTLAAVEALMASELSAHLFLEVLGFNAREPERIVAEACARLAELEPSSRVRAGIVPHAPYSVSPGLFQAIAAVAGDGPVSVHLGESDAEVDFLLDGGGPWRDLLQALGAWAPAWTPPRCGPVEYLRRVGLLDERLLAVHCVRLADRELEDLAAAGATVVTCPRSNRWTGAGTPPIDRFYAAGVRVAIGTDSLASVADLNMFEEMAAVREVAPGIRAARILRSATLDGAAALGFGGELGSIAAGKRAQLIAVGVPVDIEDVEEYLVGGRATPLKLRWLASHQGPALD